MRAKIRGYIQENKCGTIRVGISIGKDSVSKKYKYHYETLPLGSNCEDAKRRLRELQNELDKGTFCKPTKLTVANYLDAWLRDYCKPNLAPNTTQTYEFMVKKHISPAIGIIPLSALKPVDLQRLYSEKSSKGTGARTVKYIHQTLHRALKSALKLGLIMRNPADSVDVPKLQRREMHVMNETDIHLLLEFCRESEYYPIFYAALFTGMRRSELLALRWQDVDLLLCQLSVNRTIHQLHNREIIFKQPKTAKSRRLIALTPSTVEVLREHKEAQRKTRETLRFALLSDDDLVFSRYEDNSFKPLLPDSVTQAWRHLARRCGLKGVRLHDCRHSHASLLLKQNVHPAIVASRLGHASVQITMDVYTHILPGIQEQVARKFDDIFLPKK